MTEPPAIGVPAVRDTPPGIREWVCFPGAWALVGFGITCLVVGSSRVMAVGGYCAQGGPYEVAVACPTGSTGPVFAALPAVALAVLVGIFGARGFGVPVHGYFWSALFGAQGIAFFVAAAAHAGPTTGWIICGVVFVLVALLPAPLLAIGWPRAFFGRRRLDGRAVDHYGLPLPDAVVIGSAWAVSTAAGATLALWWIG